MHCLCRTVAQIEKQSRRLTALVHHKIITSVKVGRSSLSPLVHPGTAKRGLTSRSRGALGRMQKLALLAYLCLALTPVLGAEVTDFAKSLKSSHPGVRWEEKRLLKGDLTCRGRQDMALLGTQDSRVWVAILAGSVHKRPIVLQIDSALLAAQTTLSIESQDFEMGTGEPGDVGPLPGFKRSKTCKGLKLDDDRIDSVHIYWNRIEGRFQTWQR